MLWKYVFIIRQALGEIFNILVLFLRFGVPFLLLLLQDSQCVSLLYLPQLLLLHPLDLCCVLDLWQKNEGKH